MKKLSFTLVEMLVVIGVIAILMGLLFPALAGVSESAMMKQAQSDVKTVYMAIKSFKNDYHYLPSTTTNSDEVYLGSKDKANLPTLANKDNASSYPANFKNDTTYISISSDAKYPPKGELVDDYHDFFDTLCGVIHTDSSAVPDKDTTSGKLNPKHTKYLQTPPKYFSDIPSEYGYRDPWGRPFIIFLDTNYDGKIPVPSCLGVTGNLLHDDVGVFSFGNSMKGMAAASKLSATVSNKNGTLVAKSWQ